MLSPEKRLIQAGRKTRDALRLMRDLVRAERKADIYNRTFANLDGAIEDATDGLIELSSAAQVILKEGPGDYNSATGSGEVDPLQALQNSLSAMRAERDELISHLQAAQEQLQKYANDLQALYTKEREKRAELALAYERLKQADGLKSDFLSTITHELNSPLVPIHLHLQFIEKGDLSPAQEESLGKIKQKLGEYKSQLDGIIKYAMLVSQSRVINPKAFKVKALIEESIEPLQILATNRRINIVTEPIDPNLTLVADGELVNSAIYQLVHNAVKFNRPGGAVQVRITPEDGAMLFQITDDGEGIPEAVMKRFGEDFNQTVEAMKRGVEGLGLGLALSNYVAAVHGGKLTAQRGPGDKGTLVQLRLPNRG